MSAPASPSSSPSLSPTRARRLSARRGSVSASDPWGAHASINNHPSRATSSRLTIVRVPPNGDDDAQQRRHRRHGSNASIGSTASSVGRGEGSRMSFAFTSFSQQPSAGGSSPTSSPRMRPQSPNLVRRTSGSFSGGKLSPEQLLDVARQSCNPRSSFSSGTGGSPVAPFAPAPLVSFTPLADEIFLPFVDRPAEVAQLVAAPPTAKLFALLAQTFPADARVPAGTESAASLLARDPRQWTYAELAFWMQAVDRDAADDVAWATKARACIMAKSELIWARVKGALGVPPELDVDEEELAAFASELPSAIDTDTDTEEEQQPAPSAPEGEHYPVSEPPSPLVAAGPAPPGSELADELAIEPVFAGSSAFPPTSSALDPSEKHELCELREEDEEDEASGAAGGAAGTHEDEPEVLGLRFLTSPASPAAAGYAASPGGSPPSMPLGSPTRSRAPSHGAHDPHDAYDALHERGPGHPLFPSSFAHLSLAPTLRNRNGRAQSLWNPPPLAFGSPNAVRGGVQHAHSAAGGYRPFAHDWAHAYDPARHEYAVASSAGSVSGIEV
ncbi:hypothetical protein WOLCODRAFT_138996 [Wolfiporia cocos MD-104 SS10]|uniref:Uncharacterized protein n=1 Tax=Wolfiporia cocos (strain MD-104) TaxID=742152 RepID=A0A2H3JZU8_WOLCO|nr:hypothetical protein WOLCODRAFT_138996 [Wolfiporia cocos MD-104 SS10]